MPLLKNLVESSDVAIATKAIYLATMIGGSEAIDILQRAAELPNKRIRVAVGAAAADLDPVAAAAILATLMKDADGIVRGVALRSIRARQAIKGTAEERPKVSIPGVRGGLSVAVGVGVAVAVAMAIVVYRIMFGMAWSGIHSRRTDRPGALEIALVCVLLCAPACTRISCWLGDTPRHA